MDLEPFERPQLMLGFLAIPGMLMRIVFGLCVWLMFRPGGWAVVCFIAIAATWYVPALQR
jgi:hypothetical protein